MLFGSRLIWINARRWRHPISPLQDVVGIRVKGHAEMNDSYMSAALAVLTGAGMLMGGAGLAEAGQDFTLSNGIQASQTLNFDKFNTSLGTLNSVDITLSNSITGGVASVSITGGEGGTISDEVSGTLLITGPGATTLFSAASSESASCSFNGPGSCSNSGDQSNPTFDPNPATVTTDLLAFEGTGTFGLNASLNDVQENPTSDGIGISPQYSFTYLWSGTIDVTYNYTPTVEAPEPASFALLATAVGGLGLLTRRRRAR